MSDASQPFDRRTFVGDTLRMAGAVGPGGDGRLPGRAAGRAGGLVWQLDPANASPAATAPRIACWTSRPSSACTASTMCGYCELCTGYFEPEPNDLNTGAENQFCPTGAIVRQLIEDPYHEYTIIKELCIGCGKCVKGCNAFGNGSLHLQVQRERCKDCNECSIAVACPADAFRRLPAEKGYMMKHREMQG